MANEDRFEPIRLKRPSASTKRKAKPRFKSTRRSERGNIESFTRQVSSAPIPITETPRLEVPTVRIQRRRTATESATEGGQELPVGGTPQTTASRAVTEGTEMAGNQGTLRMVGGVRGNNRTWQGWTGGRAHSNNSKYQDYSQGIREYTFEQKEGYVAVGQRDGKTVYAAPDLAKDASGNYLSVSSDTAQVIANKNGWLVPRGEEVRNLYGQATHITMPTFLPSAHSDPNIDQKYTDQVNARLKNVTGPVVHKKELVE